MIKILFLFIYFSFTGYIAEITFAFIKKSKSNKGLFGPWCPIYGIGGLTITSLFDNLVDYPLLIFIFGIIICSIIEYFISFILEKIFNIKWWDYSNYKFNINGRICLLNAICFGFLSIITIYFLYPIYLYILNYINYENLIIIAIILSTLIFIDGLNTIIEAINLRKYINIVNSNFIKNIKNKSEYKKNIFNKLKKLDNYYSPKRLLKNLPNIKVKEENALLLIKEFYNKHKRK